MNCRRLVGTSVLFAAILLVATLVVPGSAEAQDAAPAPLFDGVTCELNELPPNDDGSSPLVPIGFDVNFFGSTHSAVYVNNNGNITFDAPLSTYTPFGLLNTNRKIIAPFFGDVDTRSTGSEPVRYGWGPGVYQGRDAFCVNWENVGYYSNRTDKLNTFQLVLVERSDRRAGDFDAIFNYAQIQWETGDASGGVDGLGGNSARVGFSNGTSPELSFELAGSGDNGAFLDSSPTGLIYRSINTTVPGRMVFPIENGLTEEPDGCGGLDLLVCYAPEIRFHVDEQYYPMEPLDFIEGSELWWSETGTTCEDDRRIAAQPTAERIQKAFYETQARSRQVLTRYGFPVDFACWPTGNEFDSLDFSRPYSGSPSNDQLQRAQGLNINEGFFLKWVGAERPRGEISSDGSRVTAPVIATRVTNDDGTTSLLYQLFYGYDSKAAASLSSDWAAYFDQVIAHEGDWEAMRVNLDSNSDPESVEYFAHGCTPTRRLWADAPKSDVGTTHPVGYVAEGSHATYPVDNFGPGVACSTDQRGRTDITSWDSDGDGVGDGAVWQTWNEVVEASATCWYGFGGAWGRKDDRLDDLVEIAAVLTHATGPAGLPFNANGVALQSSADCDNAGNSVLATSLLSNSTTWSSPATATIFELPNGTRVYLSLQSVEVPLASAVVDATGTAEFDFEIPAGTAPGLHQLVVRDEAGTLLATTGVAVDPPEECWAVDDLPTSTETSLTTAATPTPTMVHWVTPTSISFPTPSTTARWCRTVIRPRSGTGPTVSPAILGKGSTP